MEIHTLSFIIAAFVSASLGAAALMRNYRSRLCLSFALLCTLLFTHDALSVVESFGRSSQLLYPRAHAIVTLALGPSLLLVLRWIVTEYRATVDKWILGYGGAALLLGLGIGLGGDLGHPFWIQEGAHLLIFVPGAIWIYFLNQAKKHRTLKREKLRLRFAVWGGIVTLGFFVLEGIKFSGLIVPPLGTAARVFYVLFLFQIFIQKELLKAEEVVAKLALFGSITCVLSLIYFVLVSWVGDRPGLFIFNTLIASFVIIILFEPIRKMSNRLARKLYLTQNWIIEEELSRLSTSLLGIITPKELATQIESALRRSLRVEGCSLFLLDREGFSYVEVNAKENNPLELSASSALVEYMRLRKGRPFVLETIENDRDYFYSKQARKFCETCIEGLREINADFIVPFWVDSVVIGFCAANTEETVVLSNAQLRSFIPVSRQIALSLRNSQALLSYSEREKLAAVGEMAAGLAHEIKNPLGAIRGAAQLLEENPKEGNAFIKIIQDESIRLSAVLSDFLDYAKPRRKAEHSRCDPGRVLEHTVALLPRTSKLEIEILPLKGALNIDVDPESLKQVFLNLLLNAVQAMEGQENAKLSIAMSEVKNRPKWGEKNYPIPLYKIWEGWQTLSQFPSRSFLQIEITDNGPGIREVDRVRIFTPFFTTKPHGTGLGLAICRRLVEGMGGTIHVRSRLGFGSTFTLVFPVSNPEVGLVREEVRA